MRKERRIVLLFLVLLAVSTYVFIYNMSTELDQLQPEISGVEIYGNRNRKKISPVVILPAVEEESSRTEVKVEYFNDHIVPEVCSLEELPKVWNMTKTWNSGVSYTSQCRDVKVDRFDIVVDMWDGPIVLAVYTDDFSTSNELLLSWKQVYCRESVYTRTTLVFITVEDVAGENIIDRTVYPINFLRNVAWSHVQTEFTFVVDIDMIPTPYSHSIMLNHAYSFLSDSNKRNALIVPALENKRRHGTTMSKRLFLGNFPNTKEELVPLMERGSLSRFSTLEAAYGPTLYHKYIYNTEPYEVTYRIWFEPFVIVRTDSDTKFWESFAGYAYNYSSWSFELALEGYHFIVLHDLYILHWSHDYGHRVVSDNLAEMCHSFKTHITAKNTTTFWKDVVHQFC